MDNDWVYPEELRFEVHDDGEIWSAALWNLRGSLGGAIVDPMVIKSHTFLANDADFIDGADALLSADDSLYGGAHEADIRAALAARGIPQTGTPATGPMNSLASVLCETNHNYLNLEYQECSFTIPGAVRLRFRFSEFDTEAGYDLLRISDLDLKEVQVLSGNLGAGFSAAVAGDTIVGRFKADYSIAKYGFVIDAVEYFTGSGEVPDGASVPGPPLMVEHGTGGAITLSWGASCAPEDGDYEIYEGSLEVEYPSHEWVFCSTGGSTLMTFQPGSGSRYYFVVPSNGIVEGSYGLDHGGAQRPQGLPACLTRQITACP
jgi:hypothetical protein